MRSTVSSIVCFIKAVTNIYAMFAPTNIKCVVIAATIRTRTKGMIVATCSIYICSVLMCRKFSDSALGGTLPHIATQIRLHIVMGLTAAGVGNRYNVIMIATGLCGV